jgi:predicted enzyme related to lactoylglutathione lyase
VKAASPSSSSGTTSSLYLIDPSSIGAGEFRNPHGSPIALRVSDVADTRKELEARGIEFVDETYDTGVCHMAPFADPDGNRFMLHRRYAPND